MIDDDQTVRLHCQTPVRPIMVRVERDTVMALPDGSFVVVRAGTMLPSYQPSGPPLRVDVPKLTDES